MQYLCSVHLSAKKLDNWKERPLVRLKALMLAKMSGSSMEKLLVKQKVF